jgi:hypothetical protein
MIRVVAIVIADVAEIRFPVLVAIRTKGENVGGATFGSFSAVVPDCPYNQLIAVQRNSPAESVALARDRWRKLCFFEP